MITINVMKNTHNKSQARKYNLVLSVVRELAWEECSNGNSGYSESDAGRVFGGNRAYGDTSKNLLTGLVVRRVGGDPHTPAYMRVDPSLLTPQMEEVITTILRPAGHPRAGGKEVTVLKRLLWACR